MYNSVAHISSASISEWAGVFDRGYGALCYVTVGLSCGTWKWSVVACRVSSLTRDQLPLPGSVESWPLNAGGSIGGRPV